MAFVYRAESDPAALLSQLAIIREIADREKEALGFLPEPAYRDAIQKRRLIAMCTTVDGRSTIVGFVLFSAVFPNARIQQVAVAKDHRRAGVASALINDVISRLEARGYQTLTAAVASDLTAAQAFYEKNGFIARRSRRGGHARKRTIVLRARDLDTENLLSVLEPPDTTTQSAVDLGLRIRGVRQAPLYAIDLNVLFDVVKAKSRPRTAIAGRLVAAALRHQIRLAVAPEFVVELERTTREGSIDPVLMLARQLPRLPSLDSNETERLTDVIHEIVFVARGLADAGSAQAWSDARHLAQSALARASCYVTSDGRILDAREELLREIGIDVVSLEEFDALLPVDAPAPDQSLLRGTDCKVQSASSDLVLGYLRDRGVPLSLTAEFAPAPGALDGWRARAVTEAGEVVAVGVYRAPQSIDAAARLLVHVRPDHVACEILADHLLDAQCADACSAGSVTIELPCVSGQSVVRRLATLRGFLPVPRADTLIKVALGRPVTFDSWAEIARQTRRRTGLRLPEVPPAAEAVQAGITVRGPDGQPIKVRLSALEDALGPTIIIWPGRNGVIVPIARNYAGDLLGTSDQFSLFGSPEAAFLTRRTYLNTPRAAPLMRPGLPILFYESLRSRGRGAIIACARIVDATVVAKGQISEDLIRRAVVDDLGPLSSSGDVLATTFDNLLRFPKPVHLGQLRALSAAGSSNLQSATTITDTNLSMILDLGWSRA